MAAAAAAWILLNPEAFPARHRNATTASAFTSNGHAIEVSFSPARPALPSHVFVHCPGLGADIHAAFPHDCRVVFSTGDLLLLRVPVTCRSPRHPVTLRDCDYFVYRAGADPRRRPSLRRRPHPHPLAFFDDSVSILPLHAAGGDQYVVVALNSTGERDEFKLCTFDSVSGRWSAATLRLTTPQREFAVQLKGTASAVVVLGGERGGAVGWVDLWRGILLCDMLHPSPTLRRVPVPMPMPTTRIATGEYDIAGCTKHERGVAVVSVGFEPMSGGGLRFVDLAVRATRLDGKDEETRRPAFAVHGWAITTWSKSNATMGGSWHEDSAVEASAIAVDGGEEHLRLLRSELLRRQGLENLVVSDPLVSLDEEGVVYVMARTKFMHRKAWVLAVDTTKKRLRGVAEFGAESKFGAGLVYCPSKITQFMSTA